MNEIIIQWNKVYNEGIRIQNNTKLNTLLYADDQIIISNSEDNLQRGVHMLNNNNPYAAKL
jgi:phosphate-selective porin